MIEKIKQAINKYNLLKQNDVVVIGLSGGPDSTVLTLTLRQIAPLLGVRLIVAHYNHGLRGRESGADERYAGKLARELDLPFIKGKMSKKAVPAGVSPEDYYRRERYRFLNAVAEDQHAGKIALGHNLQDQAETVLHHLLRGSGLDGLKGILPLRDGKYIRPLLGVSRIEIEAFLKDAGINCRQDSSNNSKIHLRNKIRLELLPYLKKEYNPHIEETLAQTAEILREDNNFIRDNTEKALTAAFIKRHDSKVSLDIQHANMLPLAVQRRLVKTLLEDFSAQKNGTTFLHINSVTNMLKDTESGKEISLPGGIRARREYENLIIQRADAGQRKNDLVYLVEIPGCIYIAQRNATVKLQLVKKDKIDFRIRNKNYFDLDKISFPLVLRTRRDGDWFRPLGMTGRQKLKNFFIDHKITRQRRDELILLVDRNAVLWIENMQINDDVKITDHTKNVLELEII